MTVEIFYFEGCPNHKLASERVQRVIFEEGIAADVNEIEVLGEAAAKEVGFLGSPTIRINGIDIEPASRNAKESYLACRCYPGRLPPTEMIRAALREAQGQRV
jgi:glutaredoxin